MTQLTGEIVRNKYYIIVTQIILLLSITTIILKDKLVLLMFFISYFSHYLSFDLYRIDANYYSWGWLDHTGFNLQFTPLTTQHQQCQPFYSDPPRSTCWRNTWTLLDFSGPKKVLSMAVPYYYKFLGKCILLILQYFECSGKLVGSWLAATKLIALSHRCYW